MILENSRRSKFHNPPWWPAAIKLCFLIILTFSIAHLLIDRIFHVGLGLTFSEFILYSTFLFFGSILSVLLLIIMWLSLPYKSKISYFYMTLLTTLFLISVYPINFVDRVLWLGNYSYYYKSYSRCKNLASVSPLGSKFSICNETSDDLGGTTEVTYDDSHDLSKKEHQNGKFWSELTGSRMMPDYIDVLPLFFGFYRVYVPAGGTIQEDEKEQ